jgi:16S rRNA (cytosine1402-N4)-methyltransferase
MKEPLNESGYHVPVMVGRALEFLITDPAGVYVDATAGGGGHSEAIMARLSEGGRLVGMDRDAEAVAFCRARLARFSRNAQFLHGDFASMDSLLSGAGVAAADGVLFDLGVSSHQIDDPARGFSYMNDGPLDSRMDGRWNDAVIRGSSEKELADLFFRYGEEKNARRIARAVVSARERKPVSTTGELADILRRVTPARWQVKTLSRVFQALRIEVNDELLQLESGLEKAAVLLKQGGRLVVITYHSLEDRMVKRFMKGPEENDPVPVRPVKPPSRFQVLTRKVVTPSPEEIEANPRARSAKLRAAERVDCRGSAREKRTSNGLRDMTKRQQPFPRKSGSSADSRAYRGLLSLIFFIEIIMILVHLGGRVQIDFAVRRNDHLRDRRRMLQAKLAEWTVEIDAMKSYQHIAAEARRQGLEPVSAERLQDLAVDLEDLRPPRSRSGPVAVYAGMIPFDMKSEPPDTAGAADAR